MEIGHRVTVLRDGKTIDTKNVSEMNHVDDLVQMMVGEKLAKLDYRKMVKPGSMALEAKGISRGNKLQNLTINVRKGEVVGLAGIVGAGRTELARVIFGVDSCDGGVIKVFGKTVSRPNPRKMISLGVGFIPEDRKREGIVPLNPVPREHMLCVNEKTCKLWVSLKVR